MGLGGVHELCANALDTEHTNVFEVEARYDAYYQRRFGSAQHADGFHVGTTVGDVCRPYWQFRSQ
eukprot:2049219-Alexandrium_andersonii.AAC.1